MEEIWNKSVKEFIDSAPKVLVYAITAFVIWMFTEMVFNPLGNIQFNILGGIQATAIISAIASLAILFILLKIIKEMRDMTDALAGLLACLIHKDSAKTEVQVYKTVFKSIGYVLIVAIIFLFIRTLLNEINEAVTGIILIVIFLWSLGTIWSAGMLVSDRIEEKAKNLSRKMLEKSKPEA